MAIIHTNDAMFKEVIASAPTVLVDFYADWWGPCKMLAPVLAQLASDRSDIAVVKVNVDEAPETAAAYGIMNIPTMILFRDGKPSGKLVGFASREKIEKTFNL